MKNWERRSLGTPAKPWNFVRNFTTDKELVDLLDNQGRWGNRDDDITDRLVVKALFQERWKYRLRVGSLVWHAARRWMLVRYRVVRDAIAQKFEKVAKREKAKQAAETSPIEPDKNG